MLIPDTLPRIPGLTIETAYYPAQEVGGDFFQVLPLASHSIADAARSFGQSADITC